MSKPAALQIPVHLDSLIYVHMFMCAVIFIIYSNHSGSMDEHVDDSCVFYCCLLSISDNIKLSSE